MAKRITKKQVEQMTPEQQDALYGRFFTFTEEEMNQKPPAAKKKPAAKPTAKKKK